MENKFKKGDLVNFERNQTIKSENVEIVSIVEAKRIDNDTKIENTYIIEHEHGWVPNSLRKSKYNLDENKKYLFVSENELTLINN